MAYPRTKMVHLGGYQGVQVPELGDRIYTVQWVWEADKERFTPMLLEWIDGIWDDAQPVQSLPVMVWIARINHIFGTRFTAHHFPRKDGTTHESQD